jgi:hypothetical protein
MTGDNLKVVWTEFELGCLGYKMQCMHRDHIIHIERPWVRPDTGMASLYHGLTTFQ